MTELLLGPFAGLEWRFQVRTDSSAIAEELERCLDPLLTDHAPEVEYVLTVPTGDVTGCLRLGDEVLYQSPARSLLYARLLWHINLSAVAASQRHVLLHAAAAADQDGRAVILCAPMESGKTTLVAGLVRSGLRYLTDETVALRTEDRSIVAYPKALSLDPGSWTLFPDLRPESTPDSADLHALQWQVPATKIRPDAVAPVAQPSIVVLPRYVAGSTTKLEPVTPGAALVEVLQQTFRIEEHRRRDMEVLAATLGACACYRLEVGDLTDAVLAVRAALRTC